MKQFSILRMLPIILIVSTALFIVILFVGTDIVFVSMLYILNAAALAILYFQIKNKLTAQIQEEPLDDFKGDIAELDNEIRRMTNEIRSGNLFARGDAGSMKDPLKNIVTEVNRLADSLFNYFDNVPCCITVFDSELRVRFFNKMTRSQGYDGESIYGQYLLDALPPEEAKVWFKHADHVRKTGEDCQYKLTMQAPTGETLVESHHTSSVRDDDGKMLVAMVANMDISAVSQIGIYQEIEAGKVTKELQDSLYKGKLQFLYDPEPYNENTESIADAYKLIGETLGSSVTFIKGYVDEISQLLQEFSRENFNVSIKQNYMGDFGSIKQSMEGLINSVSSLISEIQAASKQVENGAAIFAESADRIMLSFNKQVTTIDNMRETVLQLNEKINNNVNETKNADKLSNEVRDAALTGNQHMQDMSAAMEDIRHSSTEIIRIINVIEDIALQTNLLALNASVEAARAGEHGRGFTVVADEVRNLATRSAAASKETAELLNESIEKVNSGVKISEQTAEALQNIASITDGVAQAVTKISRISFEQAEDINKVNSDMEGIYNSTVENNNVLQSNVTISQELSAHSHKLNTLIARFKIRD